MQQQPNTNSINPVVEVALVVIAGVLIIIGAVLLYLGKIDIGFASFLFMTAFSAAFGLVGINLAYKAPSPAQQAQLSAQQTQLSAQQQTVQQIASQAMAVLPAFANLLHSHAPANVAPQQQQVQAQPTAPNAVVSRPVAPPQPQQTAAPFQPTLTSMVPPTPQGASPGASTTTLQPPTQFKPPVFTPLPEISMPMAAMPAQQPPQQS